MTLVGAINASATSLIVDSTTGLPASTPFTILIDPGLASEEICDVTAVGGTTLTVTRGRDGSSGQSHDNGAVVRHGFSARDFDDSRAHEANTSTAHGVTGAVVGTTSTQTLTNKDLTSATNAFPTSLATLTGTQTLTNKTMSGASNTFTNIPTSAVTPLAALAGAVVGTSDTQTLTNKTMSGTSNTFSAIPESAITNLTSDLSTLTTNVTTNTTNISGVDGRVNTLEANTNGLKFFAATITAGSTDSSGFVTITHTCPFTPTHVFVMNAAGGSTFATCFATDTIGASTFRGRFLHASTGGLYASASVGSIHVFCLG